MNIFLSYEFSNIMNFVISIWTIIISGSVAIIDFIKIVYADKEEKQNEKIKLLKVIFIVSVLVLVIVLTLKFLHIYNKEQLDTYPDMIYYGNTENNMANGKGRLFDSEHNLVYVGNFKNDKYQGSGKEYGAYIDKKTGKMKIYLEYSGGFYLGVRNGQGKLYDKTGKLIYKGGFAHGNKCGFGIVYSKTKDGQDVKYVGEFSENLMDICYERYIAGKQVDVEIDKQDIAVQYYENGNINVEGQSKKGYFNGNVTMYYEDGNKQYEGEMFFGSIFGEGIYYYDSEKSTKEYEGQFVNGLRCGEGILYNSDGKKIYIGEFVNDLYHGYGKLYNNDGTLEFEGQFINGQAVN